ncbi:MAG: HD domain-containing protein [Patescibacteria group bacterium]|nr:HD domain-containing protein [Patescibacteria group bacterium]
MPKTDLKQILSFLHEAEKLKSVLRHSWLSSGRRESTAEHTWRMALMAMLVHPYLKRKPDLFKTLKIILVHDLVEVYAGDSVAWKKDRSQKDNLEKQAIIKLEKLLPGKQGSGVRKLWQEYQTYKTREAKFAKALDRLEVKIQHQECDFKFIKKSEIKFNLIHGLKNCEHDPFLREFWQLLKQNYIKQYKANKVDPKLYQ